MDAARPFHDSTIDAAAVRRRIIEACWEAGGGHYGGALSVVDILTVLYATELRVDPSSIDDPQRDRLVFSKGHAAIALYAVMQRAGFIDIDLDLGGYGSLAHPLQGHPDMTTLPGIDFSSGSLGQGLSVGLGMALVLEPHGARVWVVLGDGECQEGQIWEAAMLAARLGASNLVAVVDANGFQECGWTRGRGTAGPPILGPGPTWAAFGWRVVEAEGHDHDDLARAFGIAASSADRPTVVLAHTTKGKGFSMIEADTDRFHCTTVTQAEQEQLLAEAIR